MTDPSSLPPSGSLLPDATMHPRDVAAVQLRLPTFWRNNPQLWFTQVEATFDLHHISSEISRFRHLLCNLSPEVAQEVADVIAAPLNDAPYQRLKQSILDRTTTSESARLRHLLTSEELGDRRKHCVTIPVLSVCNSFLTPDVVSVSHNGHNALTNPPLPRRRVHFDLSRRGAL
ncbi:hypothetical protein HPB50_015568 [Hyalomma asiaticum]|uniref:Uncharacterized protein n=1 Tax=Hyalomma asiaticum TaxID=266040 RepID=A0ACB7S7W9_HYAAI|nr:hypothetical protein HPB50_015568 [Hyalomma asiaticum]